MKAGENIGLAGILKNTGNGDFNGTCTLSIVGETVLAENTLNVSVPANSEYDLSQLYLDTSDVPTGTYYFDIVFKSTLSLFIFIAIDIFVFSIPSFIPC